MRVAISGATGLVGETLGRALEQRGEEVLRLVRRAAGGDPGAIPWAPEKSLLDTARMEGLDAVVHLAGEPIASGRWTVAKKAKILQSREGTTNFLCTELAGLRRPPKVLVCASAVGIYGDRGDEVLDEKSALGSGFLADVCQRWEAACVPARDAGIRVVNVRIGIVLSARGGALAQMLTPFRLGLGGRLGDGRAYMSWIALEDLAGAILYCIDHPGLSGPVNGVAPNPVTNAEFTRALGDALHRPALLPTPAFALRMLLGEMANELLLSSTRVLPTRLSGSGFQFKYPTLPNALNAVLGNDI